MEEEYDGRATSVDSVLSVLQVEPLQMEVGHGLMPHVDGENLLNRITIIRRQMPMDLGIVVPMIRIRDSLQLGANTYVVELREVEVGRGELMTQHFLGMGAGPTTKTLDSVETVERAFRLRAGWIPPGKGCRADGRAQ